MYFTVKSIIPMTSSVNKAVLVAKQKFEFIAGQYIELYVDANFSKYFSIANAPNIDNQIELHIQTSFNKDVIDLLNNKLNNADEVEIKGPMGSFILKQDWHRQLLFIASGVGLAPIKSIIEDSYAHARLPKTHLYWGVRYVEDLYLHEQVLDWVKQFKDFTYVPVLTNPGQNWHGEIGKILEVVINAKHDLKNCLVYTCGSQLFVEDTFKELLNFELPQAQFVSDYHDNMIIKT